MAYESETSSYNSQVVTAFFDTRRAADDAVEDLVNAGVRRSDVRMVEGNSGSTGATSGSMAPREESKGFWDSLTDLFIPDEDRYTYAEGLRRGGYLVTVDASRTDVGYDRVLEILDREGAVDLDERESSWKSEGWSRETSGYGSYGAGTSASSSSMGTTASTSGSMKGTAGYRASESSTYGDMSRTAGEVSEEGTIAVAEERLKIGKRDVEHGRVRVRSYMVETPVSEDVSLREERVHLERRAVDRPATEADGLFGGKTIEVEERGEEAVISKEARVTEEISVGKDVKTRTETVSDTVRSTEVEVEDERGNRISGADRTTDESFAADRRRKL